MHPRNAAPVPAKSPGAAVSAAIKADLALPLVGFPDVRFTADVVVAEGDRAVVGWTGRGRHEGAFLGLAPVGTTVVFAGINAHRIASGSKGRG